MIKILLNMPRYIFFRKIDIPQALPMSLTVSLTYRCNSRCKTCNIYKKKVEQDLTAEEFDKIFRSIGTSPFWFTLTGGEPFLRKDIIEICKSLYSYCKPQVINISTNGILSDKIVDDVSRIREFCSNSKLIINLSIDEIAERHDEIRGVKGNFEAIIETFKKLKRLNHSNLIVGINTVISKYNVNNFPMIYKYLISLNPDSYVIEIAEERIELDNVGEDITPSLENYSLVIEFLKNRIRKKEFLSISKWIQVFRLEYYNLSIRTLNERKQIIPCYAGFVSAQIAPNGDVWPCCIKAESMGNLRDVDYNFEEVWFSKKAEQIREKIKEGDCFCPLANVSYTNMICNFQMLIRLGLRYWKKMK